MFCSAASPLEINKVYAYKGLDQYTRGVYQSRRVRAFKIFSAYPEILKCGCRDSFIVIHLYLLYFNQENENPN